MGRRAEAQQRLHPGLLALQALPEGLDAQRDAGHGVADEHARQRDGVLGVEDVLAHHRADEIGQHEHAAQSDGGRDDDLEPPVQPRVAAEHPVHRKADHHCQIHHHEHRVRVLEDVGQHQTRNHQLHRHLHAGHHQQAGLFHPALFHDGDHDDQQQINQRKLPKLQLYDAAAVHALASNRISSSANSSTSERLWHTHTTVVPRWWQAAFRLPRNSRAVSSSSAAVGSSSSSTLGRAER